MHTFRITPDNSVIHNPSGEFVIKQAISHKTAKNVIEVCLENKLINWSLEKPLENIEPDWNFVEKLHVTAGHRMKKGSK